MTLKRKRIVILLNAVSEILTGVGTIVLGYNDEWKYACAVMAAGYGINKLSKLIKDDTDLIDKYKNDHEKRGL